MTYLVGKVALGVVAGAPNNGQGDGNVATVKYMQIGRDRYPYVSAQAFRRWLRDSMPAGESRSPVFRSGTGTKQQAYTDGRPDLYLDDDLFGYMVAVKEAGETRQRDTVFATGTLVAVAPRRPTEDFGTMSRGFDAGANPVIHQHEFYTAELAGDVMLDMPRVGTFEVDGSGPKIALTKAAAKEAEEAGATAMALRQVSSLRLPIAERRHRVAVLLRSLAELQGGAKKAMHYGDRAPALVLLAPVKGGVNPFTRVLGVKDGHTSFLADVLREELAAWSDELDGPVLIGWAPGFLGDQRERVRREIDDLVESGTVRLEHPRVLLTDVADRIERGEHDPWFDDPES